VRALLIALLLSAPAVGAHPAADAAQAAAERIRDLQTLVLMLSAAIIAMLLFMGLRLTRDARRLRDMAMTDELTRLPNRQHLLAVAEELLDQSHTTRQPLSLIAFDIDHFKQINDRYGEAVGDQVLRRVAHCCRMTLRPSDRVGRAAGGEFIVVLPTTAERGALSVAVRLRVAVEMLPLDDIDPALQATISLGLAERTATDTLATLMAHAAQRLAQAKHDGRNRIIPAPG
jgi:diguanylate cyclase (GGDEF)-like protein